MPHIDPRQDWIGESYKIERISYLSWTLLQVYCKYMRDRVAMIDVVSWKASYRSQSFRGLDVGTAPYLQTTGASLDVL